MGITYRTDTERADRAAPTTKPDDTTAIITEVAAVTTDARDTLDLIDRLTGRNRDTTQLRDILRSHLDKLAALTNGPSLMRPTPTGTPNE